MLIDGRRRGLPPSVQGVPTDLSALGDLLTAAGWERARAEPALPASALHRDVAIGKYVDERFGPEVTDRLLEPLLAGVYAGRSRELSFAAVAHGLYEQARGGRSLTAAAAATARSGGDGPVFAGLVGGVHGLVTALVERLSALGAEIRTSAPVRGLRPAPGGGYALVVGPTNAAETLTADAVVVACPAPAAARLLAELVPAAEQFGAIPYASVAVLTVAVRSVRLEGSGLLLPPGERPTIKAVTHSSRKWDWVATRAGERWGDGVEVVRLSVGRFGETSTLQVDDEALRARTFAEARSLPGWESAELVAAEVARWGGGLPQYRVGHRQLSRATARRGGAAAGAGRLRGGAGRTGDRGVRGIGRPGGS